ncbi:unnamed protein product [Rotaria socialis]|uniref:Diacylglycerol kinase n=1 Tax=Rotaria socialis TaxID=392032 RepID=A0A819AVU2_9BILA|nr:unnamed protein product [Rotaria socialis]CAF4633640.1 unnamed protein product [Rotaria socialis]
MSSSVMKLEPALQLGVDWSDRAHPTSHCWLSYCSKTSLPASRCAYLSCTISEIMNMETCVECGSCTIVIHIDHIINVENVANIHNYIPPCRPSFSDTATADDHIEHDHHYWSSISKLLKPCMLCKRKTLLRMVTKDNTRTSTSAPLTSASHINAKTVNILKYSNKDFLKTSSSLQCLWCFKSCHKQCWEIISDGNKQYKCDYGKFKNIIVHPQWLQRFSSHPVRICARFCDDVDESNTSVTPLIVFINKISGGRKGESIYRRLLRLLNPRQIFLLENNDNIKQALSIYSSLRNTRISICGGDGSVGWVLNVLAETCSSLNNPPVSICPLGTGNDLSRVLGWGRCYSAKQLLTMLQQVSDAQPIPLDRWQITFEPLTISDTTERVRNACGCFCSLLDHPKFVDQTNRPSYQNHQAPLNTRFTNYLSFGLDAAVVLDFHDKRIRDPSRFTSPFKNKLIYLSISRTYFREFALWRAWDLRPYMRLICDGNDLTDSIRHCHTIVLLNIPSYGSGTHPWSRRLSSKALTTPNRQNQSDRLDQISRNTSDSMFPSDYVHDEYDQTGSYAINSIRRQDISDQKIEVFGLDSIQMALIHAGFRGRRIAQCSEVRIELIRSMPVHMDGEPFYLPESIAINVTHAGQVLVLRKQQR